MSSEPFWAIVEVQGRQTHAGRVSEVQRGGFTLLRVEVFLPNAADPVASPEVNPQMLYRLTRCTEARARQVAASGFDTTIELRALAAQSTVPEPEPVDDEAHKLADALRSLIAVARAVLQGPIDEAFAAPLREEIDNAEAVLSGWEDEHAPTDDIDEEDEGDPLDETF